MKTVLIKIGLFLTFCIVSVVIIACSDEFIINTIEPEDIALTSDINQVEYIDVTLGYRDSIPVTYLVNIGNNELSFDLNPDRMVVLDSLKSRMRKFRLSWPSASGAQKYEVRVSKNPIDEDNWWAAQKVKLVNVTTENGVVRAEAILSPKPKVLSGRCIGCGDCQKNCPVDAITITQGKAVIDYNKCVECGECYRSCDYNSIEGVFAGTEYFFAIRGVNSNNEYAENLYCTPDAYKMQYTTISSIPKDIQDSVEIDYNGTKYTLADLNFVGGCMGNCKFEGCHIVKSKSETCHPLQKLPSRSGSDVIWEVGITVCPVDAIYSVENDSVAIAEHKTVAKAMFIDKDKCVNCGRCAAQCYNDGEIGAVTTDVFKVVSRFLKGK